MIFHELVIVACPNCAGTLLDLDLPPLPLQIHRDVRSRASFAIHWATFINSYEPYLEPRARLESALQRQGRTPRGRENSVLPGPVSNRMMKKSEIAKRFFNNFA